MWLVAGDALGSAGMLLGIDLWELLGFGLILPVASLAQAGSCEFLWLYGGWIIGVLGVRAVAGLAGDDSMFTLGPKRDDLVVARGAGCLARKRYGARSDVVEGGGPVMAIAPERFWDQCLAQQQENQKPGAEDQNERDQVGGFLETAAHVLPPPSRNATEVRKNSTTCLIQDITLCL
jgi:hypothetical protein